MSILSVKNLEKKFGDLTVLKDISFNINDGEIISIHWIIGIRKINITALYESVRDDHIRNDHDRWKDTG